MENKKKQKELAQKLLKLAEQGVGGEKVSAENQLQKILDKYGITREELAEEKRYWADFKYDVETLTLLMQIASTVGLVHYRQDPQCPDTVMFYATKLEEVELRAKYDFYGKAFKEEIESLLIAFVIKNGLLSDDNPNVPRSKPSEEDRRKFFKAMKFIDGVDKQHFHKGLETGK